MINRLWGRSLKVFVCHDVKVSGSLGLSHCSWRIFQSSWSSVFLEVIMTYWTRLENGGFDWDEVNQVSPLFRCNRRLCWWKWIRRWVKHRGSIFCQLLLSHTWDWVQKASMIEKRYPHGCHVGLFEGNKGVFVRLVLQSSKRRVASNTGWASSPMTMLGEKLILSGGEILTRQCGGFARSGKILPCSCQRQGRTIFLHFRQINAIQIHIFLK